MNRITSAFGVFSLASIVALSPVAQGQDNGLSLLKKRVSALESRVAVLESQAANSGTSNVSVTKPEPPTVAKSEAYIIKEGDTISEIARRMNVPRSALMDENDLREGQQIYIGDEIRIPVQPAPEKVETPVNNLAYNTPKPSEKPKPTTETTPKTPAPSGQKIYTVKYGDNLTKIARSQGVTVAAIKQANGLKSDIIGGGQRLKIPSQNSGSPSPTVNDSGATLVSGGGKSGGTSSLPSNETFGEYTVEKGDNLYALARDFFTTMKHLQQLNGLGSSTLIRPGEKLVVPTTKYNEYHNKVANR